MTWRQATRDELRTFYQREFPHYLGLLPDHVTAQGPKEIGIAFDQSYPIKKDDAPPRDFIRRDTRLGSDGERVKPAFTGMTEGSRPLVEFIQTPAAADPLGDTSYGLVDPALTDQQAPLPAAVYHSLACWERSHIVAIDIDAKDIAYERVTQNKDPTGTNRQSILQNSGVIDAPPAGFPYAFGDINQALRDGFAIREILEDDFAADETLVVYSGQGCHVYLLDDDSEHRYDTQSRDVLANLLTEQYGFTIDRQVTVDSERLIRLPYSLHSEVCRMVQPIQSPDFEYRTKARPTFLQEVSNA